MTLWQKRARIGVATVGIAGAIAVYAAMGHRVVPVRPDPPPNRVDPKALIESSGTILQQVRGTKQDYVIKAQRQLTYEGGRTTLVGVEIAVANRGGRDFTLRAREAEAGERQQDLHLTGDVRMEASDGFSITTEEALFSEGDGVVRAPGAFGFAKGRMTGSGVGMTYDKQNDILTIADQTQVSLTDEEGAPQTAFSSASAVFTRPMHLLALDGMMHAVHLGQEIDADQATAQLTPDDGFPEAIALRGHARVTGGGQGLDTMSARDIDLHYAVERRAIDRAALVGGAAVGMTGGEGAAGRQFFGETLTLVLAPDGTLTGVTGRDNVRLELGGRADTPARSIRARTLDASGAAGSGLTEARFADAVQFREQGGSGGTPRTARARALRIGLLGDAVEAAWFSGGVQFEERGLQASAAEVRYDPVKGTLRLTGRDAGGGPHVADPQVTVDADSIDLKLSDRVMSATGSVKTVLGTRAPAGRERGEGSASKLPGLLRQDAPANVNAGSLEYAGEAGQAVYSGAATLWQGETAVRADVITVDQNTGDLIANGSARSTIPLDGQVSVGRGAQVRFVDADHRITFEGTSGAPAQVSGPQGDLRARRIVIALAATGAGAERLEAYDGVSLSVDTRTASGARLTYFAEDARYVMTGAAAVPVKVVEGCRETTGKTLTFYKATDRVIVDGNEEIRTHTTGASACPEARPR